MVERNFSRVQDENKRLKEALQYADNVVYGNSIASMSVGAGNRGPRVSQLEGNRSLAGEFAVIAKQRSLTLCFLRRGDDGQQEEGF